ncbi:hypothetical protein GGI20_005260 [Coemansia sp. BCRC 34301]|nr:hypothetical protein GGI20_005260 [Coemansia sp. BCRC 34301]
MSFPDTLVEDRRAAAAQALGIGLDRRSAADLAVITTISVVYFLDFVAVLFMLWNRRYPPIKAKSPLLMASLFAASALWFAGDVQMNGHVTLAGTPMERCRGLGFWVRILAGICGVCALFALRSFALFHVFRLNRPFRGLRLYVPIMGYVTCIAAYGIAALVLKPGSTLYYVASLDLCSSAVPFKATVFAFIWATLAVVGFNYWRIRHITSSFNESREMGCACLTILATMLFQTLVHFLHPQYPLSLAYRVVSTVLSHLCTNVIWWGVMAVPLWNCAFRKQRYLDKWVAKLRMDGLQREYCVEECEYTPADIAMNEAVLRQQGGGLLKTGDDFYYACEGDGGQRERSLSWLHSRDSKDAGFGGDRYLL